MLRRTLIAAADSDTIRRIVTGWGPARRVVRRFVAGETLDEAVAVTRRLNAAGFRVALDELGESVTAAGSARDHADGAQRILDRIDADGLDASLSVKPTALGIDVAPQLCRRLAGELCARAAEVGTHVTLDMEGSAHTQATVELVEHLRKEGHDNVGCAVQAYLHRTLDDVRHLTGLGASLRICKGAYAEPDDIAYHDRGEIADRFVRAAEMVLTGDTLGRFATHDHRVIARIRNLARRHGVAADAFELQMLYGVREPLQARLLGAGHPVRIYVPFGSQWYRYLTRRLAERPANLAFFLRALAGGRGDQHHGARSAPQGV